MSDITLDVGLALKLKNAFGRNGWTEKDVDGLCEGDKLARVLMFVNNGYRLPVKSPATLTIDRSRPFDPAKFIGRDWTIEEQDERSLSLTKIDLAAIVLEVSLKNGERSITGEENLKRLKKANHIRLDVAVFLALWENQHLIPESWKGKYISFDGTVLRNSNGDRYALYLYWFSGRWCWSYCWFDNGRRATNPSAVLAS